MPVTTFLHADFKIMGNSLSEQDVVAHGAGNAAKSFAGSILTPLQEIELEDVMIMIVYVAL
jgi:hypothetical protein